MGADFSLVDGLHIGNPDIGLGDEESVIRIV